jgi:exopolysaccharide biosynthesis polyprenyl glycosylphosphotransferase
VCDSIIILTIIIITYILKITLYEGSSLSIVSHRLSWLVVIALLLHIVSFYIFELYNVEIKKSSINLLFSLTMSIFVALGLIAIVSYIFPEKRMGRIILTFHVPFVIIFIFLWRKLFFSFFARKTPQNKILIIGTYPSAEEVNSLLSRYVISNYHLVGAFHYSPANSQIIAVDGNHYTGELLSSVQSNNIKTLVTDERFISDSELKKDLLILKVKGVSIYDYPTFYEALTGKIPVSHIEEKRLIFSNQGRLFNPATYINLKRVVDVLAASVGLILSIPFFIIIPVVIKLTSRGSVFFLQERLGLNERPFIVMKFRTMIDGAETETGPQWSSAHDPRVTRVGRFLRKSRLDELPQLINILKGDMSIVGPRPIRKYFADIFSEKFPFYRLRFTAKPGITGWAQVRGDYAGTEEGQLEKLEYDLFYIQNRSVFLDCFIILKTIQTVLLRKGE